MVKEISFNEASWRRWNGEHFRGNSTPQQLETEPMMVRQPNLTIFKMTELKYILQVWGWKSDRDTEWQQHKIFYYWFVIGIVVWTEIYCEKYCFVWPIGFRGRCNSLEDGRIVKCGMWFNAGDQRFLFNDQLQKSSGCRHASSWSQMELGSYCFILLLLFPKVAELLCCLKRLLEVPLSVRYAICL